MALNIAGFVLFIEHYELASDERYLLVLRHSEALMFSELEGVDFVTAMFRQASLFGSIANLVFLWVVGDNIEDAYGHIAYLGRYLATGIAGLLAYIFVTPNPMKPLAGASGGVYGLVGSYLVLFPQHELKLWRLFNTFQVKAFWVIGFIFGLHIYLIVVGHKGYVSANIAGFGAGALLTILGSLFGLVEHEAPTSD